MYVCIYIYIYIYGPRVVVPDVEEAGVAADGDEGQRRVGGEPVHRRVQALEHEPSPAVLWRELEEEPRLHQHRQRRAGADEEVRGLEVILLAAGVGVLAALVRALEGDGLHGPGGQVLEPGLHPELVVVEAHRAVRRSHDHARLVVHLQHVQRDVGAELDDLHGAALVRTAQAVDDERQVPDHHVAVHGARGRLRRLGQEDCLREVAYY